MSESSARRRLLVFVIAYYAEHTLRGVLERIPSSVFEDCDCEILVVDDGSEDRTFEIGREYQAAHAEIPMTVLRNWFNQGYGGNQKVGYAYAIREGFDFVAMLHGDGQYAPENLPRLLQPLRAGHADAVFGSRMMMRGAARRGGMPLYKYLGNRLLTAIQNRLLGTAFSELHSGYRIYSVAALSRLPFLLNTDDFHFDTEIMLQFLNAGLRIVELPIPTYYGSEISRVNGLSYAKDVVVATLANAFHRMGVLYQRRFDPEPGSNRHYSLKLGYPSSHTYALEAVPSGSTVLDLGSGSGDLARELVRKGCRTATVDRVPPTEIDGEVTVYTQDLDEEVRFPVKPYRYILLLDIIEHLHSPEAFLARLRKHFDYETKTVIVTTPNIAFAVQRLMLLFGQFNYGKAGVLDTTHTHLFTFRGARRLLLDAGFRIKRVRGVPAPFPKALGDGRLARVALALNGLLIRLSKTLFAYQIYIEAESTPDVDFVLRYGKERSGGSLEGASARPS